MENSQNVRVRTALRASESVVFSSFRVAVCRFCFSRKFRGFVNNEDYWCFFPVTSRVFCKFPWLFMHLIGYARTCSRGERLLHPNRIVLSSCTGGPKARARQFHLKWWFSCKMSVFGRFFDIMFGNLTEMIHQT